MYYAEEVINGVLCWRGTPTGPWTPLTPEQLTRRLLEAQEEINGLIDDLSRHE